MCEPVVEAGLSDCFRLPAAELYFSAFWPKLAAVLGSGGLMQVAHAAAPKLRADRVFSAHDGQKLLGIAAFKQDKVGFVDLDLSDLRAIYGSWGGLWRGVALSLLERRERRDELLMDGICVATASRGTGVGTRLLDAIEEQAVNAGLARVRLDVIDTNPRAQALYERRGFRPVTRRKLGPLARLFNFEAVTEMHKTIGSRP